MHLSVPNSDVIVLFIFCCCCLTMVCHLLWQRIIKKMYQCEVCAYVIFGLLIYSILKQLSRDVRTNPCFFQLSTALIRRKNVFFCREKLSCFFVCGSNDFGFTMNLDAPNEESIRSVAYVESLSLTESLFLIFPPNSTYD